MKTRLLLTLLALGSAAQAQTAPNATPQTSEPFFRDVPPNHWAFAAVQRLAGAGIVQGFPRADASQKTAVLPATKTVVAAKTRSQTKVVVKSQKAKAPRVAVVKSTVDASRNAR